MGITRERLQHAVNSTDLSWSEQREKDVDVLTAMGFASARGDFLSLGGDLCVLKQSTRSKSIIYVPGNDLYKKTTESAIKKLWSVTRHAGKDMRKDQRLSLAGIAVTEWINDLCGYCHGNGKMKNDKGQIVAECPECGGTGDRTYTDAERIETLIAQVRVGGGLESNSEQWRDKVRKLYFSRLRDLLGVMADTIDRAQRVHQGAVGDMLERY